MKDNAKQEPISLHAIMSNGFCQEEFLQENWIENNKDEQTFIIYFFSISVDWTKKNLVRRPGVEPGSIAWKATMLTVTPPTLLCTHGTVYTKTMRQAV